MSQGFELPDLSNPDAFEKGFPHELFRRLRREAPLCWHEGEYDGGPGYWVVSRYETIKTISRQPLLFSSASGTAKATPWRSMTTLRVLSSHLSSTTS